MKINARFLAVLATALASMPAYAQEIAGGIEFSKVLLGIAIILGLTSSLYVFVIRYRLQGSNIGSAVMLYGMGMLSIVISLVSVAVPQVKALIGDYAGTAHDLFFIVGFILMVLGSRKLARLFRAD